MRLDELARRIGARTVAPEVPPRLEVARVFAGDRVSDILDHVSASTLLVTNLATSQLIRVADLLDLPAVCLVGGQMPEAGLLKAAADRGTAILVSPVGLFETCGRLYACLATEDPLKGGLQTQDSLKGGLRTEDIGKGALRTEGGVGG